MNVVPDTSAVIDGRVSERVDSVDDTTVLVPEAVVSELESQANDGRESGWDGLAELQELTALADAGTLSVQYVGRRASPSEARGADEGDVDAVIRDIAASESATLLTSDVVQAEVAKAKGVDVEYIEPQVRSTDPLIIEQFFDEDTMSVHLKTETVPKAKRGAIGEMRYEHIRNEPTDEQTMQEWANNVEEVAQTSADGFIELSEAGMKIIQYQDYRIAVARPPFADGIEITAVRPIVKTDLDEYEFASELRDRLKEQQRGILISGSPGAGKSTFAQAVAEFLTESDYAVKNIRL